jgi:hypothetical protein
MKRSRMFLGHKELASVRKLRGKGKLDEAEKILLKGEPSPSVLDELRKIASAKARLAKKEGDWEAVVRHLEGYSSYAKKWRRYCVKTVNQEPPTHAARDRKLLQEAKSKLKK